MKKCCGCGNEYDQSEMHAVEVSCSFPMIPVLLGEQDHPDERTREALMCSKCWTHNGLDKDGCGIGRFDADLREEQSNER